MAKVKVILLVILAVLLAALIGFGVFLSRAEQPAATEPIADQTEVTEWTDPAADVTEETEKEKVPAETEPEAAPTDSKYEERDNSVAATKPVTNKEPTEKTEPEETKPAPTQGSGGWIPGENETERDE